MNTYDRGGFYFKSSGPLDIGLADPGHMVAISLHQITVALLLSSESVSPHDLMALTVLQRLVDSVGDLFLSAEIDTCAGSDASAFAPPRSLGSDKTSSRSSVGPRPCR